MTLTSSDDKGLVWGTIGLFVALQLNVYRWWVGAVVGAFWLFNYAVVARLWLKTLPNPAH